MKKELQTSAQDRENKLVMLDSHVANIKDAIDRIANDFFRIGYYLWEIKNFRWYEEKGYKDIVEFSEKELNFKKRSTYNFIAIVENFAEWDLKNNYPKMWIADKYRRHGYSQLCEMLSLSEKQRDNVNVDMTVKEIRQLKKSNKTNDVIEDDEQIMLDECQMTFDIDNKQDVIEVAYTEVKEQEIFNEVEKNFLKEMLNDKYNWITMLLSDKEIKEDQVKYTKLRELENLYFSISKKLK